MELKSHLSVRCCEHLHEVTLLRTLSLVKVNPSSSRRGVPRLLIVYCTCGSFPFSDVREACENIHNWKKGLVKATALQTETIPKENVKIKII